MLSIVIRESHGNTNKQTATGDESRVSSSVQTRAWMLALQCAQQTAPSAGTFLAPVLLFE